MEMFHEAAKTIATVDIALEIGRIEGLFPQSDFNELINIHNNGSKPSDWLRDQRFTEMVQNCVDWLHHFGAIGRYNKHINELCHAYSAKHRVENWVREFKNDADPYYYIPMHAFIVAARLCGFRHTYESTPAFNIPYRVFTASRRETQKRNPRSMG